MTKQYTIIRFTQVNRRTREQVPCWLASVSFKPGDGMRVGKMSTTRDREQAARFSLAQAYEIAVQFSQFPAALERPDGTPMPEDTQRLQDEQASRHAEIRRIRAEINSEFSKALEEIGLGQAIRRALAR